MSDKPVIGFIGLGFMGHGMAKNIRKAGYELYQRSLRLTDVCPVSQPD
jgi:3-hydroxyisobutyrate dehydrogenase-like beta-hydroxyacid dehydrogenase